MAGSSLAARSALLLSLLYLLAAAPRPAAGQAPCAPANATEAEALLQFRARLTNGPEALPDWGAPGSSGWSGVGCGSGGLVESL